MSRFFRYSPPRRVTIPDGNDQPLTSEIDGQRFTLNKGDTSVVDGEPALTIDNDRVALTVKGELATTGDTSTVEVNGDDARIVTSHGGSIEAEDTTVEINGEDALVLNGRHSTITAGETAVEVNGDDARVVNTGKISGGFNGVSFASDDLDDGLLVNFGTITSDSRAVNIDGEDVTVINHGHILGTGDQRNGTIYADASADDYNILNYGLIDAGKGNQGAGVALQLGDEVDANVVNTGDIVGRGNAAASTPLAGDGIRLFSGVAGESSFTGRIFNSGDVSSDGANGTVAGIRVANGVGFEGTLVNARRGTVSGTQNGVYFGDADHNGGEFVNRGKVTSDSRAVNLDGDDLTFSNRGEVLGTGNQRNGTVYIDGTGDDITVDNRGRIDAGKGNLGDGVAVQVGASTEDATNENIEIVNRGTIQGRGQAEFADGARVASNGSSGVRFFNGSGEAEATVTGSIVNSGRITAEVDVGFLGGLVVEDDVAFDGTITNERGGLISGPRNGLYIGNADHDLTIENEGRITSGSRVVNLDGDNVTFRNDGDVIGTGNQRNGTVYVDGTGDDITVENTRLIDAGRGNLGDGISVQVGSSSEDATNENINIVNRGTIQGRGQAEFADGARVASNGSSGVRFFNGSGEAEATVTGSIVNSGRITAEVDVGFLGGLVVEDDVAFDGTITNERGGLISGPRNGLYIGNADHDLTIENEGRITSGSRVVNLDGDNVTFRNDGDVIGTGDQRNGTVYLDGTADNITVENTDTIDAGRGNNGSGVSVQVGSASEDALNEDIVIDNDGLIQGRGDGNVPSGVRFFNGSGEEVATVTGSVTNRDDGEISSESEAGILIEDGVAFNGTITNDGVIEGGNGIAIDASGSLGDITLNQNGGEIRGDVLLGAGDDVVNVNGGSIDGIVDGGAGEDDLTAGAEGNVLNGGSDNDTLTGAQGDDTFVFERGTDQDTVEEFDVLNDILNLSDFGFADVGEVQAASNEQQIGGEVATVIDLDGDAGADQVTLLGVAIADLNAGNVELDDQATGV